MLVVDLHTLEPIHILHLIDDILLNRRRSHDRQDVGRCNDTIRQRSAGTDSIMLLHQNLLGQTYKILALLAGLGSHDDFTVTTLYLAHGNLTVDF